MTQSSLRAENGSAAHLRSSGNFPAAPMIFGGVIATLVVVATLLGIKDDRNFSQRRATLASGVAPVAPEGGVLAHEARSGQLAIAVTGVTAAGVVGDPLQPEPAQGGHVLVGVRVINDGDDEQRFEPAIQQLIVGDQTIDADQEASVPVLGADLGPGDSVVASIAFDVPAGAEPSAIVLRDSATAPGTQLSLAEVGVGGEAQ